MGRSSPICLSVWCLDPPAKPFVEVLLLLALAMELHTKKLQGRFALRNFV
jgi:hypothetical protein